MLQFKSYNPPEDLFDSFSENDQNEYLWEMLQGWMIFITQREKDGQEVASRMYFYELLNHLLSYRFQEFHKHKNKSPASRQEALRTSLVELLNPLAIYEKESEQVHYWYLLLPHLCPNDHDELEKVVGFLASSQYGHQIHYFSESYLKENLEEGNAYLVKVILPCQATYLSPNFAGLPHFQESDKQMVFSKAANCLEIGLKNAQEFWSLARQSGFEIKPFLLHQSAELVLRAILMAWEKLEKKTHEIRVLLRYAAKYNPGFESIFNPEEDSLLNLLDKCYAYSRYHAGFIVPEESLQSLETKVDKLLKLAYSELEKLNTLARLG